MLDSDLSASLTTWSLLRSNGDVSRRLPLRALNSISQLYHKTAHACIGDGSGENEALVTKNRIATCLSPDVGRSKYQPRCVFQSTGLLLVTRLPPDSDNTVCATKLLGQSGSDSILACPTSHKRSGVEVVVMSACCRYWPVQNRP